MDLIAQARTERTQIASEKETILARLVRLDGRLAELDIFLRVAEGYSTAHMPEDTSERAAQSNGRIPTEELTKRGAQKRMIEEALQKNYPHGLTKSGVGQWIKDQYGIEVTPNSIGVTLDRLKRDEKVRLDGNRWVPQFEASGQ